MTEPTKCRHPRDQRRMNVKRVGSGLFRRLHKQEICKLCGKVVALW